MADPNVGRVQGKVALVTGAARGMGRAIAVRLAEEGAKVAAIDAGPLDETVGAVEQVGGEIATWKVDVRDAAAVDRAVSETLERFDCLDVVAINHGIAGQGRSWELTSEEWQRMIDVNLTGAWNVAKAVAPRLINAGRGGSVIFTGSTASMQAAMNLSHYVASKHGLLGLMRSLAIELGPSMIRVNAVLPGAVDTPLLQESRAARASQGSQAEAPLPAKNTGPGVLPVGLLDAVDIAQAVLWLASDEARYVSGVALPVDAGALAAPAHRT